MRYRRAGRRFRAVVVAIGATISFQFAATAWAHDAVIIGAGSKPCSRWTEARATASGLPQYAGWVLGFVSAGNVYALNASAKMPGSEYPEGLLRWMDMCCRDHPEMPIYRAAISLVNGLRERTGAN
jgi:hypothetical protein